MSIFDTINFLFGLVGLVGTIIGVISYIKARRIAIEKLRFSWSDVVNGSRAISKKGIKKFKPDAILTFSGAGSIFGNLALLFSGEYLPIYTVVEFPAAKDERANTMIGFIPVRTSKWLLCIPETLLAHIKGKILVIHDSSISGTGLAAIKQKLIQLGFKEANIFMACFVATKASIDANLAPDFYFHSLDNSTFYYPWGERK